MKKTFCDCCGKDYDDFWKEACETQKKMDEDCAKLHEGMASEEILDYR